MGPLPQSSEAPPPLLGWMAKIPGLKLEGTGANASRTFTGAGEAEVLKTCEKSRLRTAWDLGECILK